MKSIDERFNQEEKPKPGKFNVDQKQPHANEEKERLQKERRAKNPTTPKQRIL